MSWDKDLRHEYVWPTIHDINNPQGETAWAINKPPDANWEWCFGGDWYACTWRLYMKSPPNMLQRFLMRHLLGIYFRKIRR